MGKGLTLYPDYNDIKLILSFENIKYTQKMNIRELILYENDNMVSFDLDKYEYIIIENKLIITKKKQIIEEKVPDTIPEYQLCPVLENYINNSDLWPQKEPIKKRLEQIKQRIEYEKEKMKEYNIKIIDIQKQQIGIEEEQQEGLGKYSRACYLIQSYRDLSIELEKINMLKIQSIALLKHFEKEFAELVKKT